MNVGIMVSSQTPLAGGGFTFEEEILNAFFRLRTASAHHYFLVGYAAKRPAQLEATGLPWLSLHPSRAQRRRQKWSKFWCRLGRRRAPKQTPPLDFEAYADLKKQPLDLICYLTPLVRPVADIPYLTTVWDLMHRLTPFFPEVGMGGEWESRERRYREVLPRAAYVLALNRRGQEEVVGLYGVAAERVRALTLPTPGFALREGVEPAAEVRSLAHLGVTGEYFFYPAQFWAHKNHACLLLTLKILRDRHGFKPQLVLPGGDKGNQGYVRQLVLEHGLGDQVLFPGFVTREDLTALYRQALALLYPSFFGPENLPPLEAMALGCPVVASAFHDLQLGDAAILADPTQPEAWADAIWSLHQDPARRHALIARGHQRARSYTPDHYVADLLKIINEFAAYRRCWPAG